MGTSINGEGVKLKPCSSLEYMSRPRVGALAVYNDIAELGAATRRKGAEKSRKEREDWQQLCSVLVVFVLVLIIVLLIDQWVKENTPPKHPVFDD